MDFQRLLILAGLAVTAYMLVLAWNRDYGPDSQPIGTAPPVAETVPAQPKETPAPPPEVAQETAIPEAPALAEDVGIPQLETASAPPPRVEAAPRNTIAVSTDVFELLIDLEGGDIVRLALPQYPISLRQPDTPFLLLDPKNVYVSQSGLIGPNGTDQASGRPTYAASQAAYRLAEGADSLTVPLRFTQADGTQIVKRFDFRRGDYLIDVTYEVQNRGSANWTGGLFAQIKRDSQKPYSGGEGIMGLQPYVGGATRSSSDELYDKLEFTDVAEAAFRLPTFTDGYIAMVQHYFVSAWVPPRGEEVTYSARKLRGQDLYLFGYTTGAQVIPPGSTASFTAQYYAGPKHQSRLREIARGLDLTIDYGFLWWLSQPLFALMEFIHGLIPNWGVAIIGLTLVVKLALYPLSAASYRSMAKMRKLQPEMQRLKERFGDDRQKFSQAMMELYKKEGANPLGGCFPILLQMPVFLALYWTLIESVELRQAPFILWIDDLSAMDPYFVLPVLMGISMYLTQMMQPEPPDPMQAKVFKFMPIIFTFFFLWFPAGLVLYWFINNVLSILQQWYVTKQIDKPKRKVPKRP